MTKIQRRSTNVFSLSFLDAITCGFGAVILLFVLMNARQEGEINQRTPVVVQRAEVDKIDEEILDAQKDRFAKKNSVEEVREEVERTEGLSEQVLTEIERIQEELAKAREETLAREEHINELKSDIEQKEEAADKRLDPEPSGQNLRTLLGDGRRQYLTGLRTDGDRNLILLDRSASMTASTLTDITVWKARPPERRREAPKWQQVQASAEWLLSNLPPDSLYQIYTFSNTAQPLLEGTRGRWLNAGDTVQLEAAVAAVYQTYPEGGTNLQQIFELASNLSPEPDNIFLLTDGLPTLGEASAGGSVTGRERERIFARAIRRLPRGVPVNVILFQLQGDPAASPLYWELANDTNGSYLAPSPSWPSR